MKKINNWPQKEEEKLPPEDVASVLCARIQELHEMEPGDEMNITINGLTLEGEDIGDWVVKITRREN